MANLETLSAPKLNALIEKRSAAASAATKAAIAAGLGSVRFNEMRELAADGNEIARAVVETWDGESEARDELRRRNAHHGTDHPIRRAA